MIWGWLVEVNRNAALTSLIYMVRALLAGPKERLVGENAQPWAELLERITRSMRPDLYPVVVPLLTELSNHRETMTESQRNLVGDSARRVFEFAWTEERRKSGMVLTALEAVCRTYESDPGASGVLIRRSLEPEHLSLYGYEEMPCLTREVERLIPIAPALIEDVYRAILFHEERSDEAVPLGRSEIMPMTSNRRQDWGIAVYQLGEMFPTFAKNSPIHATGAVIVAVESVIASKALVPLDQIKEEPIQVGERHGMLAEDLSHIWDCGGRHRHDARLQILDEFEAMLIRLAGDPANHSILRQVLSRVVRENRFAAIWRRVLRAASSSPKTLGLEVRSLAWSHEILIRVDTREPAGTFLGAIFPLLTNEEKERAELAILSIPDHCEGDGREIAERQRDRLLGCLPGHMLVTDGAKTRIAALTEKGGAPTNDPPFWVGETVHETYTKSQWLTDQGVKVHDESNRLLIELSEQVEEFYRKHSNEPPEEVAVRGILPILRRLYESLRLLQSKVHPKACESGFTDLARVCATIARSDWLANDSEISNLVRGVLLDASTHESPVPEPIRDEVNDELQAISPTPRLYAAEGLCHLARNPTLCDREVQGAIRRLSHDPVPAIRAEVARRLGLFLETARDTALDVLRHACLEDESRAVMSAGLSGGKKLVITDPEIIAPLLAKVFERAGKDSRTEHLRRLCLQLSLAMNRGEKDPYGGDIVAGTLGDIVSNDDIVTELICTASGHLFDGPIDPPNGRAERVRLRSIEVLTTIARQLLAEFRKLDDEWKRTGTWSDDQKARAKVIRQTANQLGLRMQIAAKNVCEKTSGDDQAGWVLGQKLGARFLREGTVLLDTVQELPFPDVIHYLIEALQSLVTSAPGPVLLRIAKAVRSGTAGAYQLESLGLDAIVKLIRRYLADYRRLLQEERGCRDAIVEILDVFVRAGWPAAMELTFRLEEIFR